jgi:hypothetical protein
LSPSFGISLSAFGSSDEFSMDADASLGVFCCKNYTSLCDELLFKRWVSIASAHGRVSGCLLLRFGCG